MLTLPPPACVSVCLRAHACRTQAFSPLSSSSSPVVLGYALDGHAIYGPYDQHGRLHDGLDNCNGKFLDDGTYAYFATPTFPYLLGCFGPGQPRRAPDLSPAQLAAQDRVDGQGPAFPYTGQEQGEEEWDRKQQDYTATFEMQPEVDEEDVQADDEHVRATQPRPGDDSVFQSDRPIGFVRPP